MVRSVLILYVIPPVLQQKTRGLGTGQTNEVFQQPETGASTNTPSFLLEMSLSHERGSISDCLAAELHPSHLVFPRGVLSANRSRGGGQNFQTDSDGNVIHSNLMVRAATKMLLLLLLYPVVLAVRTSWMVHRPILRLLFSFRHFPSVRPLDICSKRAILPPTRGVKQSLPSLDDLPNVALAVAQRTGTLPS